MCFAFFVKNSKIEYDPHFWGGENFLKIEIEESSFFRYPVGLKNLTKSLYLTWLRRYKQFCVLLIKKILGA